MINVRGITKPTERGAVMTLKELMTEAVHEAWDADNDNNDRDRHISRSIVLRQLEALGTITIEGVALCQNDTQITITRISLVQ